MTKTDRIAGSFRDPSGFLFTHDGLLLRQVNQHYQANYDHLMESGLYERLRESDLMIEHTQVEGPPLEPDLAYKVIQPERVPFISYPYEWSFSQLKDAALTTLTIQSLAFEYGMTLKDSSAYNIQFHRGRPMLIDTLSFEIYKAGEPWVAYRQFCQHFLAPLALMALRDVRLSQLLRVYIDGIPLDFASRLVPARTKLNFALLSHLHLHALSQQRYADKTVDKREVTRRMSENAFRGLIESLKSAVSKLTWKAAGTEWGDYYQGMHNYTSAALEHKTRSVEKLLDTIEPGMVWDLGANVGVFSRLASKRGVPTIAFDIDPAAVEHNYRRVKEQGESNLLPLLLDLTNPSPSLGWHNRERMSILERGEPDVILALALVHHLAISNNVPLGNLAAYFHEMSPQLIVEFVPKEDSQVQRLLTTREDIFTAYTPEGFENAFGPLFRIQEKIPLKESERILYHMTRRA